jgi:hypothetical protein
MLQRIKLLIADEGFVIRQGLLKVLETCTDIEIIGDTGVAQYVLTQSLGFKRFVVIFGPNWSDREAIVGAIRQIKVAKPNAWVIALGDDAGLPELRQAGADVALDKRVGRDELLAAIRSRRIARPDTTPNSLAPLSEDPVALYRHLLRFSVNELKEICLAIGVDYEDLDGENRVAKARELVQTMKRQDDLTKLVQVILTRRVK